MSDEEINEEALGALAREAGLQLTDKELPELLPRVKREKAMALSLRSLMRSDLEPAPSFKVTLPEER